MFAAQITCNCNDIYVVFPVGKFPTSDKALELGDRNQHKLLIDMSKTAIGITVWGKETVWGRAILRSDCRVLCDRVSGNDELDPLVPEDALAIDALVEDGFSFCEDDYTEVDWSFADIVRHVGDDAKWDVVAVGAVELGNG